MKTNKLQQLMDGTLEALAKSNASDYFQKLLKTVSRQFIIYADERGIPCHPYRIQGKMSVPVRQRTV